jgi:hypothetical protein
VFPLFWLEGVWKVFWKPICLVEASEEWIFWSLGQSNPMGMGPTVWCACALFPVHDALSMMGVAVLLR